MLRIPMKILYVNHIRQKLYIIVIKPQQEITIQMLIMVILSIQHIIIRIEQNKIKKEDSYKSYLLFTCLQVDFYLLHHELVHCLYVYIFQLQIYLHVRSTFCSARMSTSPYWYIRVAAVCLNLCGVIPLVLIPAFLSSTSNICCIARLDIRFLTELKNNASLSLMP